MNQTLVGYIFFTLTAFAFGSFEVVSKIALHGRDIDALHVNLARYSIGLIILLPFALYTIKKDKLTLKDHFDFMKLGILLGLSMLALVSSIPALGSAALAGLIFSANPIFTVWFGHAIAKEKSGKYLIPAVTTGIIGMIVLSIHKLMEVNHIGLWGLVLVVFSAITFSLYSVLSKIKNHTVNKHTNIFFTFIWTLITFLVILLYRHEPLIMPAMYSDHRVLIALLWIGIVVTGLGYIFYFKGMELAGVHKSTSVFFLKPLFTATLAWVILGESITWNMLVGTLIFLLAMYLLYKD